MSDIFFILDAHYSAADKLELLHVGAAHHEHQIDA
jgi:hypothetical protein